MLISRVEVDKLLWQTVPMPDADGASKELLEGKEVTFKNHTNITLPTEEGFRHLKLVLLNKEASVPVNKVVYYYSDTQNEGIQLERGMTITLTQQTSAMLKI